VIARAQSYETAFRTTGRGREPLAPPSGEHVHYQPRRGVGIGSITSRPRPSVTFWELLAFKLGCNVTTAKRLYEEGLIS
jgi:hypothetical protein